MKVSVVSVFHDRANVVTDSVNSLIEQNCDFNYELILVDDNSNDETYAMLMAFDLYPNVKIIKTSGLGFVSAIKLAISESTGNYIAIHGSGDKSLANRLQIQANYLDSYSDVGVVGGVSLFKTKDSNLCYRVGNPFHGDAKYILKKKNMFHHGEVMFRKSVYDEVGGYNEFFTYAQDRDLWCRMSMITNFAVVESTIYERVVGQLNSVSGSFEKSIKQKALSNLAVTYHKLRLKNCDITERYSLEFLISYMTLSNRSIIKTAINYCIHEDFENLNALIKVSYAVNDNNFLLGFIFKYKSYISKLGRFFR